MSDNGNPTNQNPAQTPGQGGGGKQGGAGEKAAKAVEKVQKAKKNVDRIKKIKNTVNTIRTLASSGPLLYVLFWVAVVILIIIIITGIIMFLVTMPGMVMEKLKAFFKELGNAVAAFFGADTTQQIDDEKIFETLDYIETMGWDLKGEGFLTKYYADTNPNNFSSIDTDYEDELSSEEKDTATADDEQGVIRGDGENIILADSLFLYTYIMSDNYVYTLKNDNVATQNGADNWWESFWAGVTAGFKNISNFVLGPVFDAVGLTDASMDQWGKGLIVLYTEDGGFGHKGAAFNGGNLWNWDSIKIDSETKKLSIKKVEFLNNNNTMEYSLDGWTGRYGMPLEFLLAIHKATMMPDLAYDMVTSFNTNVNVYLHDLSDGEAIAAYKTPEGEYITYEKVNNAKTGMSGRNIFSAFFSWIDNWFETDEETVAMFELGVDIGKDCDDCVVETTYYYYDAEEKKEYIVAKGDGNKRGSDSNKWYLQSEVIKTEGEGEEQTQTKEISPIEFTGDLNKLESLTTLTEPCESCKNKSKKITDVLSQDNDYNFATYEPYIANVTEHWYRDVYFVLNEDTKDDYSGEGKVQFVDYDYDYEAMMKERWTLYETYTDKEEDKNTYKYNPDKVGEFIVFRIDKDGNYMKDSKGEYVLYDGTFDEARGNTVYIKNAKDEYIIYEGDLTEEATKGKTLYRKMAENEYAEYKIGDDPIAVAKKAVTIDSTDTEALKDLSWEKHNGVWSAYKVNNTKSSTGWKPLHEEIDESEDELTKYVKQNSYININTVGNVVQVGEGQRTETNAKIKKMFLQNKYFRYDGSTETAEIITELRSKNKKDDVIQYGALSEEDLKRTLVIGEGENKKTYTASNYAGTVSLNTDSLNAFSMLENTHTLDSDYIYRDFKELVVELGYFEKEELTDETPKLLQFLIPAIGSGGYPDRTIDKRENEFGTMIHSKHDVDVNQKYTLKEMLSQMESEVDEENSEQTSNDSNATNAQQTSNVTQNANGILTLGNKFENKEIGAIEEKQKMRNVSQVSINEFLETTREMCEYINKEGYDYCVLVGDAGDGDQNCTHGPGHGNSCSLPRTFKESQEDVSKHNFCCATLVSWALQNVGVMPDEAHLDGAPTLATWIEENLDSEVIKIGTALKPGDILCYGGHIDLVGEEHNGGFVKYNGGHITTAGSVEFEGNSCIEHIDGWPNGVKYALRLNWGNQSGENYRGFIGNEAVVSPVTGILLEYGTYDEESVDSVSGEEYRVNVDIKYGPSLGEVEEEEGAEGEENATENSTTTETIPAEETGAEETTEGEEKEEENPDARVVSDKVGYAKILVLNKEAFEIMDSEVEHKWKKENKNQGLLTKNGAFSNLVTTEEQLKELTEDTTRDFLSETVYGYKEFAENYEKYGIAGQVVYIDGFKCELPDEKFVDTDEDEDLSDENGNPDGEDLEISKFEKIDASNVKNEVENKIVQTQYEMPASYKVTSKKATERLNVEEQIKNDAYSIITIKNPKTYKPLENMEKLVFIKEGTVLGRTYTDRELVEERIENGDDPKFDYKYYVPDESTTTEDGEEKDKKKLIGNYIRTIMRDLDDTVVENVEDYMKLDELTSRPDCAFEHLAYFLGCIEESFNPDMDLGNSYGVTVLEDGAGNTTAFGLTKYVAGTPSIKAAYPDFGAHLASGSIAKEEVQDVYILTLEAAKESIQDGLNTPLEEDDPSLYALIDLYHASPSMCYDAIDDYNEKSNNLTADEKKSLFAGYWGSNENYATALKRRAVNRGWLAAEGRWFMYQEGSEGNEVIFDTETPWTEFCEAGGNHKMTTADSGLYHVESKPGNGPQYEE